MTNRQLPLTWLLFIRMKEGRKKSISEGFFHERRLDIHVRKGANARRKNPVFSGISQSFLRDFVI
jgi:hypothetical protein